MSEEDNMKAKTLYKKIKQLNEQGQLNFYCGALSVYDVEIGDLGSCGFHIGSGMSIELFDHYEYNIKKVSLARKSNTWHYYIQKDGVDHFILQVCKGVN